MSSLFSTEIEGTLQTATPTIELNKSTREFWIHHSSSLSSVYTKIHWLTWTLSLLAATPSDSTTITITLSVFIVVLLCSMLCIVVAWVVYRAHNARRGNRSQSENPKVVKEALLEPQTGLGPPASPVGVVCFTFVLLMWPSANQFFSFVTCTP